MLIVTKTCLPGVAGVAERFRHDDPTNAVAPQIRVDFASKIHERPPFKISNRPLNRGKWTTMRV